MPRHSPRRPVLAELPTLRIIGGTKRGRSFHYSGDPRTRPMKDRVREAVFNLLGPSVKGTHVVDLFAGTGALGLEALSRGALHATFFERHFPTAKLIEQNAELLELTPQVTVTPGDTFHWASRFKDPARPWLIFCAPPYDMYLEQAETLQGLLLHFIAQAPTDSTLVIESDERWQTEGNLPGEWRTRDYPPARISILRMDKSAEVTTPAEA